MRFAHSLGYPHHELMIGALTRNQYRELLEFFRVEQQEREELREQARESNLRQFFDLKIAQQKAVVNG